MSKGNAHSSPFATYRTTLVVIAAVVVSLQAASWGALRGGLWGSHFYAFLPAPAAVLATVLLAAAAFLLYRRGDAGAIPAQRPVSTTSAVASALATAVACAAIFWTLRSRQTLLGDAVPLMIDLPGGKEFHPRQPLAMWVQQRLYQAFSGGVEEAGVDAQRVARDAVATGSIAAGAVFALVAVALGRLLARDSAGTRATPWLVSLVLLTQGYTVLFYGYVENYAYATVLVALYLGSALRYLEGRLPLAVVALTLVAGVGAHLSSIALAPSFLWLAYVGIREPARRADGVAGVVCAVAAAAGLDRVLRAMSTDFTLWKGLRDIVTVVRTSQGGGAGASYAFSPAHLRDFAAEHVLIGPLATLLLLPALGFAALDRKLRRESAVVFLALASGVYLVGSWSASEPLLGYARDWDLFAPAGVCYCATALYVIVRHVRRAPALDRLLAFAVVLSLVHTAPWVWINHTEALSIERFATLPLGGGRTEAALGNHYLRNKEYDEAERWFRRALAIDATNPNANSLLGRLYGLQGRYDVSAEYLRRAVMVRPDKPQLRQDYTVVLLQVGRCRDALPHAMWLAEKMPEDVEYWHRLGETMLQAGCAAELRDVYRPVLEWLDRYVAAYPSDDAGYVHAGIMLARTQRFEEAVARFERALSVNPTSAAALMNLGMTLKRMGRDDGARARLDEFLARYPEHPQAAAVQDTLEAMRPPHAPTE